MPKTAKPKTRKVSHIVDHHFISVRTKFADTRISLTLNHYGPKASMSGEIDRDAFKRLYDAFTKMYGNDSFNKFGNNGGFMLEVKKRTEDATSLEDLISKLAA